MAIAVSAYVIPLTLVSISAITSGWFSLYDNALSDLGHAVKSNVAPLFNLGLSLGAILIIVFTSRYAFELSKLLGASLAFTGMSLNLVAVFDEAYGPLHLIVSMMFFLSLLAVVVAYAYIFKTYVPPTVAALAGITSWLLHFTYRVPRGAAIPELISILVSIPFYMRYVVNVCKEH